MSFLMLLGLLCIITALIKGDWRIMLFAFLLITISLVMTVNTRMRSSFRPSPKDESDVHDALNSDPRFNNEEP